ncbi:ArsC family reductase [Arcticibacter sp.]|jgi:arsenate reductase|uniref:ArsC family reductase n=1 Tax=Arcticibacter sp. TaxID=1872630 RepID=UPI00388D796C
MVKVYGIKNCSTVKKALDWLDGHQISYEFHDFKKWGIDEERLRVWSDVVGWEALVNKRGTTWKQLDPGVQQRVVDAQTAFPVLMEKTSIIKRPVVETGNGVLLGFDEARYAEAFGV